MPGEDEALPQEQVESAGSLAGVDPVSLLVSLTDDVGGLKDQQGGDPSSSPNLERIRPSRPSILKTLTPKTSWTGSWQEPGHVVHIVAAEVATFYDVFGVLGVPMIIMFMVSAAWTFMTVAIQVHADSIANGVMKTTDFDNGEFWLLPKPDTSVVVSAVILLTIFGIGYTGLAVTMIFFYRAGAPKEGDESLSKPTDSTEIATAQVVTENKRIKGSVFQRVVVWMRELPRDIREHYFTAALDLPKLVFQTLTLSTYLRKGFPAPIIYYYSVLLLCNWLVACYRSQRYVVDPDLIIARLYYTFDLFFAVFAPLVVLIYYIESFEFDREEFFTRIETLRAGSFDVVARIFGDPSQISSFCSAFHYLQFSSGTTLFYKSALNLLSLYKWRKIILTLIRNYHERQLERKRKSLVQPAERTSRTGSIRDAITKSFTGPLSTPKVGKHFAPKLFLSLIFLVTGICMFVYSIGSVKSTNDLCSKYDKCVVASYQWNFGEKHCTCLVFADRQMAPKTYAEWTDPEDTTANLAELATSGELRIIQIINRAVPELPEELKKCVNLQQLILAYTKTQHLPEWISEFSRLEYFHIEGDYTSRRLQTVADGIFDTMSHLTFLHMGAHPAVEKLPSLSSLTSLRYLALVGMISLEEIPSFDGLSELGDVKIAQVPRVTRLPSLEPLVQLKSMILAPRNGMCCNGFISGTCNMTKPDCLPIAGEKYPLTCTDERISTADKTTLSKFGGAICADGYSVDLALLAPNKHSTDELCNGTMYKQCTRFGSEGMCFNNRLMVINCDISAGYIAMRKLQIQRGVGDPCNPEVEAWLGCT
ncbi:hypothetical protein PRIC1_011440 [Phytophthora ramorum]